MKIKVEPASFVASDRYEVRIQIAEGKRWIDFGEMNYTERAELAAQLRQMANELLKVSF